MAVQGELLSAIPYFSGLAPAELAPVKEAVFERLVERGGSILMEGEPAEALYFVAAGVVKVFKLSPEGKEQILYLIRPGESFNDVPVFTGGDNLASAAALTDVALYGLKKKDLEAILSSSPRVSLNIIEVLSQRIKQLLSLVEDLSFRHVTGRIARILLEHIGDGSGGHRLSQQEMAAMAGTAREIVGRSLRALEREGIIRLERHRVVITDKQALGQKAG